MATFQRTQACGTWQSEPRATFWRAWRVFRERLKLRRHLASAVRHRGHPTLLHMRDGEVVLYRRTNSPTWQTRYKLKDGSWCRASTRKMSVEHAVKAAGTIYDEARFRQSLGLAQTAQNFAGLAHATLNELRSEMDAGRGWGHRALAARGGCLWI